MDGFGLAMFLPLLEMVSDPNVVVSGDQMGKLAFIVDGLQGLGISLNLTVVLLVMLLFFSFKGLFMFLEQYKNVVYRQYFIRLIRETNIKGLSKYSFFNFITTDVGRIQNTMTGEVERVSTAFNSYMLLIQQSVLLVVYSSMALLANAQFALLVMIGGIITNLAFNKLYAATKRLSREFTKSNHSFQGLLIQQVGNFKYLKASGLLKYYSDKLIQKVHEIEISKRKIGILHSIMQGLREPLLIAVVVVVIIVQVTFLDGQLALIILSLLFFYRALQSVIQLQMYWNKFLGVNGSLENMEKFTKELHQGKEITGKTNVDKFENKIEIKNASFSFANDEPILKNINLTINKFESIAFVGESGSGKTTLMNIISGLLKVKTGNISIDSIDYEKIDIQSLQKRIGYITQEPVIFSDTLFNNVTFWSPLNDENLERFWDVMEKSSLNEFVQKLSLKEQTVLGNNGINLSGGQKQRISIARELYKNVDFLLMDEATSALDSETEKSIQESIEKLKGKYTILAIAHRLSTIKNADKVVVLNNGEIEQMGSYSELINTSSSFNKMVMYQEI